jgi:hypothetical protein
MHVKTYIRRNKIASSFAIVLSSLCLFEIREVNIRGCNQKFPDSVDNEIYAYNNKHMLRSNTEGYGGKTH